MRIHKNYFQPYWKEFYDIIINNLESFVKMCGI